MEHYGIISLLPVVCVVALAIITKRTVEPLLFGSVFGFILLEKGGFFSAWLDAVYAVLMDAVTIWIILVCGLFGSLIALLEKSGGAMGFSNIATKFTKNRSSALINTWVLGIIVFVDDYLNALAVGAAMRKVTDKFKVPREFLAFVINSTGAAVCVLIPFSTWSAFMAGQLEANGVVVNGTGTGAYIATIPFILYAWAAVICVPLFAFKIIPVFGPMVKAIKRAEECGENFPPSTAGKAKTLEEQEKRLTVKQNVMDFVIPMLVLAGVTVYTKDMLWGVIIAIATCAALYFPRKLMRFGEFFDNSMAGFKDMLPVLAIIAAAFFLQRANEGLGLTTYVIESVKPLLSGAFLPVVTFIIVSFLTFTTGSFWGIAAIAFPIILPLAQAMDVNIFLVSGAVISAATFGSHSCFYGDAVTLSCSSSQIENIDYAKTVTPLIMVPAALGILLFLIFGLVMS
ncbi:MAG: sodium:proton antiporter [Dethiobacter sp.]|jgi:Na+/H+ antiporter NhaC|nr:sodium:proton antiporter [Dethiobacter sp.]